MESKEAIRFIEYQLTNLCGKIHAKNRKGELAQKCWDSLILARKALQRDIPMKPKKYIDLYGCERDGCPACDHDEILYAGQEYCCVCGQRIDWDVSELPVT